MNRLVTFLKKARQPLSLIAVMTILWTHNTLAQNTNTGESSIDSTQPSSEQTNDHGNEGRWFQVEMIVFAQNPNQRQQETWPTNIAIAYPPNWKQLEDPEQTEHVDVEALLETADYYQLPIEQRLLNNNIRDLERSVGHRVLFHEAWRQQVWGADEAPSLLINGGKQYGEHFELEGSVQLSVARYLHLKTNLWFTEFHHNFGQEASDYPPLPAVPTRDTRDEAQSATEHHLPSWDQLQLISSEYEKILDQPYVSSRITTMQQKRRMRSKEIHYIDHPVIGILIYILPYELPETEPESEAEIDNSMTGDTIQDQSQQTP